MSQFTRKCLTCTEKSRQLGFLRFRNLDFARDFMDRNFPSLYLHGPNASNKDKGTKVRIAYSREREDRTRARAEGDWTCKMVRWLGRGISGKLT
jgi:hypothetical protein